MELWQVGKVVRKIWNMNLYINLDASFQNRYYAVDGANNSSGLKTAGLKILFGAIKFGLNMALNGGGGGLGSTNIISGGLFSTTSI